MPDLSACYFCGTALDEPLSEYPVVPMTLTPTPEEQKTVVLCSACRRKLGRVLDTVLDAVEGRPIDATVQQDLETASEDVSTDDDSVNTEAVGDDDEGVEVNESADVVWATADEADGDQGEMDEVEVDAGTDDAEDEGDAGHERDDGVAEVADERAAVAETTEADDADTTDDDADTTEDVAETETEEGQRVDTGTDESDATEPADPPTAADGNGEDEDGPHLSALEYTKVMRLLENRDLPVDRDEFRVVATNAYQITAEEFDTVVDAAIDRGLIVEEDGKFVDVE